MSLKGFSNPNCSVEISSSKGLVCLDYRKFPGLAWVASSFTLPILSYCVCDYGVWSTLGLENSLRCHTAMKCSSSKELGLFVPVEVLFLLT